MKSDFRSLDSDSRTRARAGVKAETPAATGRKPYRNDTTEPRRRRKDALGSTATTAMSSTRVAVDRAALSLARAEKVDIEIPTSGPTASGSTRPAVPRQAGPAHSADHKRRPSHAETAHQVESEPEVTPARSRFGWLNFQMPRWVKYSLMAIAIALMVAVSFMKPIDKSSESQIDSAMTRALIGFGIARTLNGVISVAQGTEFAVQPAGVGVNFSPGEILDPINDLVERFSWVMLVATSSLGIQKILLEVSSWIGISFMLAGAALFWLLTKWQGGRAAALATFASRLLLVMLVLRFLIPLGSIANDWVYHQFLEPRFESSSQQLAVASERIREISTRASEPEPEADSIRQKAKNLYNSVTNKFDFEGMLEDYSSSAENVSEHAVNLIVVFLLQTILFPLLFLFLIYKAFRYLLLSPIKSGS